nr:hypothetical protein [uncultured Microbacterium sp.]
MIAVAKDARAGAVMSHSSAAVLWKLPLYRVSPVRVHMTTPAPGRISSSKDVRRHVSPLPEGDVSVVDGIRCTSLARTVLDLIGALPIEAAVSIADAAERRVTSGGREDEEDGRITWRRDLQQRIDDATGARGIRQARWVADFADGRAHLPGESVSRLQLFRLGFERPDLQVPVLGPEKRFYFVDFGFRRLRAFGEFDGKSKYLDETMRSGKSLDEVMLEEKQREDWIRGTTQWRLARWQAAHITTARALGARLASFGIAPP